MVTQFAITGKSGSLIRLFARKTWNNTLREYQYSYYCKHIKDATGRVLTNQLTSEISEDTYFRNLEVHQRQLSTSVSPGC